MLFDGWKDLLRVAVVVVPAYVLLLAMLRVTGKRALAKMNAFDLIITITLGSTLASTLLTRDVTLAEGAFAFALLLGLQYLVTLGALHSRIFRHVVSEQPRLLVWQGRLLDEAMQTERISVQEIHAAIRAAGHMTVEQIDAVVLENDGTFSVIEAKGAPPSAMPPSAMTDVQGFPPAGVP